MLQGVVCGAELVDESQTAPYPFSQCIHLTVHSVIDIAAPHKQEEDLGQFFSFRNSRSLRLVSCILILT